MRYYVVPRTIFLTTINRSKLVEKLVLVHVSIKSFCYDVTTKFSNKDILFITHRFIKPAFVNVMTTVINAFIYIYMLPISHH